MLAAASRLLLLAMVSVPPISAAEVVEEFLATAAAFEQSAIGGDRWIRVAADVLHFIASGDIPLPKVSDHRKNKDQPHDLRGISW